MQDLAVDTEEENIQLYQDKQTKETYQITYSTDISLTLKDNTSLTTTVKCKFL